MFVDFRPTSRLRGAKAIDAAAAIGPVFEALCEDSVDLAHLRMVCDWIQYRANFRDVVDLREILPPSYPGIEGATVEPARADELEIAIDLRRSADESQRSALKATTRALLAAHRGEPSPPVDERLVLEAWRPGSQSCIWEFNRLYWQALDVWEKATGQLYESALPGGESDARNTAAVRELIRDMFSWWDQLAARNALPDELYVVELGVGNGNQAKTWLDEFRVVEAEEGREYYRRLHYLMCDYSPHVLEMARETVAAHASRVSSFVLDATKPTTALAFLKYKVFLVYISNVYDNLPTDEVARIDGRSYLVETRAYLPGPAAIALERARRCGGGRAAGHHREAAAAGTGRAGGRHAGPLRHRRRRGRLLAPGLGGHPPRGALRAPGRARPLPHRAGRERRAAPADPRVRRRHPDARQQRRRGQLRRHPPPPAPVRPPAQPRPVRPGRRPVPHRLPRPGKYDGSVVNWINGPLLTLVGSRKGFDVRFEPFRHREGTNIVTMTARVRD